MSSAASLFEPYTQRGVTLANRLVMSPMCQYSAVDGTPTLWHWAHLTPRAMGGVGLVILESTGVSPRGLITPGDLGLWNDTQESAYRDLVKGLHALGTKVGIQLSHAGRKGSTDAPWRGGGYLSADDGGWPIAAPSALPYSSSAPVPRELREEEIAAIVSEFGHSAARAAKAGFDVVEIHAAHGYLIHQFLSPLANTRQDGYGGAFSHRVRFLQEVARSVRQSLPADRALWVRLPVTDWADGGWTLDEALAAAHMLKEIGVDLIDCSSGRVHASVKPQEGPLYHGSFAREIRSRVGIATGVVGNITSAKDAQRVLDEEMGDVAIIGRELLRDPYAPLRWNPEPKWPVQYLRAWNAGHPGVEIPLQWGAALHYSEDGY